MVAGPRNQEILSFNHFANPATTRIDNPAYRDIVKTLNV
jgi:hypothetical protein